MFNVARHDVPVDPPNGCPPRFANRDIYVTQAQAPSGARAVARHHGSFGSKNQRVETQREVMVYVFRLS